MVVHVGDVVDSAAGQIDGPCWVPFDTRRCGAVVVVEVGDRLDRGMALEVVERTAQPGTLRVGRWREGAPLVPYPELPYEHGFGVSDREGIRPVDPIRETDVVEVDAHPVDIAVARVVGIDVAIDLRLRRSVGRIPVDNPRPGRIADPNRVENVNDPAPGSNKIVGRQHRVRSRAGRVKPVAVELAAEERDQDRPTVQLDGASVAFDVSVDSPRLDIAIVMPPLAAVASPRFQSRATIPRSPTTPSTLRIDDSVSENGMNGFPATPGFCHGVQTLMNVGVFPANSF